MSTHVPGFQSFSSFLHTFVLTEFTTNNIRVNIDGGGGLVFNKNLTITRFSNSVNLD